MHLHIHLCWAFQVILWWRIHPPVSEVKARGFSPWVGKIPWSRKWQPIKGVLPGKVPWTEEPGGPQSMGLQRMEHNWACTGWDLPILITPKLGSIISYMPTHQFSSVAKLCLTLWPHGLQRARLPCSSATPRACSDSFPSSWWCHPSISSSVVPFSSRLQSVPGSGSSPMNQFFASGGQSIGAWGLASVLPKNGQDWLPLGLFGLISLPSKGLSGVFSNTAVQKHQLFSTQLSLKSNSHIRTWLLEKP